MAASIFAKSSSVPPFSPEHLGPPSSVRRLLLFSSPFVCLKHCVLEHNILGLKLDQCPVVAAFLTAHYVGAFPTNGRTGAHGQANKDSVSRIGFSGSPRSREEVNDALSGFRTTLEKQLEQLGASVGHGCEAWARINEGSEGRSKIQRSRWRDVGGPGCHAKVVEGSNEGRQKGGRFFDRQGGGQGTEGHEAPREEIARTLHITVGDVFRPVLAALSGHTEMSAISPLSGLKRTSPRDEPVLLTSFGAGGPHFVRATACSLMMDQQPHPAVAAVSAHFARWGKTRSITCVQRRSAHRIRGTTCVVGTGGAVRPITLCLSAQGPRWTDPTIAPAFDGLKISVSRRVRVYRPLPASVVIPWTP